MLTPFPGFNWSLDAGVGLRSQLTAGYIGACQYEHSVNQRMRTGATSRNGEFAAHYEGPGNGSTHVPFGCRVAAMVKSPVVYPLGELRYRTCSRLAFIDGSDDDVGGVRSVCSSRLGSR